MSSITQKNGRSTQYANTAGQLKLAEMKHWQENLKEEKISADSYVECGRNTVEKNNRLLRVVTAYPLNPCGGPYTAYAQHQAHYNKVHKSKREPRTQMLTDLQAKIHKWK